MATKACGPCPTMASLRRRPERRNPLQAQPAVPKTRTARSNFGARIGAGAETVAWQVPRLHFGSARHASGFWQTGRGGVARLCWSGQVGAPDLPDVRRAGWPAAGRFSADTLPPDLPRSSFCGLARRPISMRRDLLKEGNKAGPAAAPARRRGRTPEPPSRAAVLPQNALHILARLEPILTPQK